MGLGLSRDRPDADTARPSGSTASNAQHQIAHVSVAQYGRASCIGRKVAADLVRAFRTNMQRKEMPGLFRGTAGSVTPPYRVNVFIAQRSKVRLGLCAREQQGVNWSLSACSEGVRNMSR